VIRVKICGITNPDDAIWAAESGADAIGFVFASSPRRITPEKAQMIRQHVPPFVSIVGVFVEPDAAYAREVFEAVPLDYIQYHGYEEERLIRESIMNPRRIIRAIPVSSEADLAAIERSPAYIILLDAKVFGKAGGTGKTFDWTLAAKAREYRRQIILSGGLTPENVGEAIRIAAPDAVDVSTGVESEPGKKDRQKMQEFIRRAKGYAA
jgi:phosphoribosylanthranilate isomerase